MAKTSSFDNVSTKQQRIAELAIQSPQMALTSLNHHIDLDWLHVAYQRTRRDGAVGVDGQTAEAYEASLMENLQSLLDRAKSGTYRAPPVRRVHIPKGGSTTETRVKNLFHWSHHHPAQCGGTSRKDRRQNAHRGKRPAQGKWYLPGLH